MKTRSLVCGCAALLFLAACQRSPAPPAPTAAETAQPAATATNALASNATLAPAQTATQAAPTPAATLTPSATFAPTPNPTVTPDPNLGVGDVVYEDRLDGSSGWEWGLVEENVAMFSIGGGQLNAVMIQPNVGPRFSLSSDTIKVSDQQVRVTARTNLCYERDEYGLIFRGLLDSNNNYNMYVFKLNCGGSARVELSQNLQATPLVDWTPSPAIVSGAPAENTLMVWMAKDVFHFYVNDKYLFSAQDPTYAEGFYGFYLRDRTIGGESVSFANLVARAVKLP